MEESERWWPGVRSVDGCVGAVDVEAEFEADIDGSRALGERRR